MLTIKSLTALELYRARVAHKPEIIEDDLGNGLVCFSVMKGIGSSETYSDAWTREARGITFNVHSGKVVSRPFHKFFNVNERESTQLHKLDWTRVTRVMDKRDGSMIHPVIVRESPGAYAVDHIRFKSKKVFDSDVAIAAQKFLKENNNYETFIWHVLQWKDATPIFEWTSPHQRIVLGYDKPELKLTHIRQNETGEYWKLDEIRFLANKYNIPMVDEVTEFSSFEQMVEAAKTRENIEGWVVQFDDGEMVKVKTDWYMARHRAFTYYRERDIVKLIMDEMIDDVKAMFVKDGVEIDSILDIEHRYAEDMRMIIDITTIHYEQNKHLPAREIAAKFKDHLYFGLIMAKYNGKEPKYLDFFERHMLKQNYGLNTLREQLGRVEGEDGE